MIVFMQIRAVMGFRVTQADLRGRREPWNFPSLTCVNTFDPLRC
jgi:hypothetical protein